MKTGMRLGEYQPVGEAGTPWAETEAGTRCLVQAFQTASNEAQTLQPVEDLALSHSKVVQTVVLNRFFHDQFRDNNP